jgi:outer membrane protein OmpU
MNKLTKVGCSALCGSLAAISAANAGDLTVTGGAHVTYVSTGGQVTGNPFGMASAVSFKGTGELDNGWTFGFYIDEGDAVAFSAARVAITMGGLGTLEFDQGNSGNGIAAYDNVLPTAWEEAHGAGLSGGVKTVLGVGGSDNIQYTSPTVLGTTVALTYAHEVGKSDTADKSVSGSSMTATGAGYDATIKINPSLGTEILSGLNLYAGGSVVEQYDNASNLEDKYELVGAVTYALGPVEVGAMWSGLYDGNEEGTGAFTGYKNHGFGVAFNVSDDLSVSYGEYQTRKAGYNNSNVSVGEDLRVVEVTSWQAAYTMGGASFRVADVKADNVLFDADADQSATIVSMGLAF